MAQDFKSEVDRCKAALDAIVLIADCYASSEQGAQRIQDVADMLRMPAGHAGPSRLRDEIANAIERAILNKR